MSQHIHAIYVNGVFRTEQPVDIADGERVALTITPKKLPDNALADVLDHEFIAACRERSSHAPTLASVRDLLATYTGSLADLIIQDRDER